MRQKTVGGWRKTALFAKITPIPTWNIGVWMCGCVCLCCREKKQTKKSRWFTVVRLCGWRIEALEQQRPIGLAGMLSSWYPDQMSEGSDLRRVYQASHRADSWTRPEILNATTEFELFIQAPAGKSQRAVASFEVDWHYNFMTLRTVKWNEWWHLLVYPQQFSYLINLMKWQTGWGWSSHSLMPENKIKFRKLCSSKFHQKVDGN